MSILAFTPHASRTVGVTTAQQQVNVPGIGHFMRFCNAGAGNVFVLFYEVGQATPAVNATTSLMIPSGAIEIYSVASDTTQVAVIGDSTGTTLCVSRGEGQ